MVLADEWAHDVAPSAIYDLFRLSGGMIVEHGGIGRGETATRMWNNDNAKF